MVSFLLTAVLLSGAAAVAQTPDAERDEAIAVARKALAAKQGAEASIQVEDVEAVDWPDAALGCPEKGMIYAQMIVPGYRVRLESGGRRHEVHVGMGRAVMCGEPPAAPSMITSAARAYTQARRELARSLALPESAVQVKGVRPVKPSDPKAACDAPGRETAAPRSDAFWVDLEAAGKTYLYRADAASAERCDGPPAEEEKK